MVRLKHRYILAQILEYSKNSKISPIPLSARDILNSLREKVIELYGDIGVGDISQNSSIRFYDTECLHIFVMKVPREVESMACFALSCIQGIRGQSAVIRTIGVSGSDRTCRNDLIAIYTRVKNLASNEEKKLLIQACVDKFPTVDI